MTAFVTDFGEANPIVSTAAAGPLIAGAALVVIGVGLGPETIAFTAGQALFLLGLLALSVTAFRWGHRATGLGYSLLALFWVALAWDVLPTALDARGPWLAFAGVAAVCYGELGPWLRSTVGS